ncbi:MAG TPA: toll/interleukin-1 receptor domain-containing protein [Caulobacteraceae bacterium]|nr:toll/interleukin-1 receptor domain-containing protein [Caulobacteraceae bacterium]
MTALDRPDTPPAPAWDEEFWDVLLTLISKDRVIPVLGRAMSVVRVDGRAVTMDRYVAGRLADKLGIDPTTLGETFGLDAVVRAHMRRKGPLDELYPKVNTILKEEIEPPDSMVKLAQIPSFRLFVTTAFDQQLARAIAQVDGEGACDSVGFVPSDTRSSDLPVSSAAARTVYHLLGQASPLPEFVISDDDLLEYVIALHDSERRPARLFDQLRSHDLLILGANLSDWLVRQFLRLAKHQRLSERSMRDREFIADESAAGDPVLVSFLSSFSPQTKVFSGGPQAFIDELHRRWFETFGNPARSSLSADPDPDSPAAASNCEIFVSYARQDIAAATALVNALRSKGFRVWFDANKIEAAEDFDYVIRQAIKSCALFMPLISRHTEEDVRDAYFRLEWKIANERDERNDESVRFIMPLVVDETPLDQLKHTPANFMRKHILRVAGGAPTDTLLRDLESAVGKARR